MVINGSKKSSGELKLENNPANFGALLVISLPPFHAALNALHILCASSAVGVQDLRVSHGMLSPLPLHCIYIMFCTACDSVLHVTAARGQTDNFLFDLPDLGVIDRLVVGHNGGGKCPCWHLDKVCVPERI